MTTRIEAAKLAARAAGKTLKEKLKQTRQIQFKDLGDLVTDADFAADRIVRKTLHKYFPSDQFLSEEDSKDARKAMWARADKTDGRRAYLWVVDPLDGTTNYAHRIPSFCVSIGLYHNRAVQLGVIYDPLLDNLFFAERGRGAFLNGVRLAVSNVSALDQAVVGTEWARPEKLRERTARILTRMIVRTFTARSNGAAALSLCYVAAGWMDAYFHLSLSPWDVAAGALIIKEAGGRVTTPRGARWTVHSEEYLASNGKLHSRLMAFFK